VDTLHQPRNTATINYQCLSMSSGTMGVDLARWSIHPVFQREWLTHCITPYLPICDVAKWSPRDHIVITTWSHRMDHRVPTCDFLFLIMRSTYYSLGLTKWGEHPQQQQELKTMRPYEKVKFEALGLS